MSVANLSFLRRVLAVDAGSSVSMGVLVLAFADGLGNLLQLPAALLQESGLILVPFAAAVGFLASRAQPARWAVRIVIAANVIWAVDSTILLFTDWVQPNALGIAFVVAQAVVVGVLAELEIIGLSRAKALPARG